MEPGGFPVRRILQQIQLGVEGVVKIKNEVLRAGQEAAKKNSESGEYNSGSGRVVKMADPRERLLKRRWML